MTPARRVEGDARGREEGVLRGTVWRGGSVGASAALERFHSEIEFHMTAIFLRYCLNQLRDSVHTAKKKGQEFAVAPLCLRLVNIVNICVRIWVLIEYAQARLRKQMRKRCAK